MTNYYEILNVPQDASRLIIREAYLRLKNAYSLEGSALYSLGSEEEAKHQIALIEEAYQVLNDDLDRAKYDSDIGAQKEQAQKQIPEARWTPTVNEEGFESSPVITPDHINTVRSTLKVMRTHALKSFDPETLKRYEEVLNAFPSGDGETLKALRDAAYVSEDEILERTKISIEYLRALEANLFQRLPQPVYVRGFLRSYLRYLNVPNYEKIVSEYAKRFELWLANAVSSR